VQKIYDKLGCVVKSARQAMQLTQSQLAQRLGITAGYLKAIENSGKKPSFDLLHRIINELELSTDYIFYAHKKDKPSPAPKTAKGGVTAE
jgi:transcriptional regulator with XRE-family HTH domain